MALGVRIVTFKMALTFFLNLLQYFLEMHFSSLKYVTSRKKKEPCCYFISFILPSMYTAALFVKMVKETKY